MLESIIISTLTGSIICSALLIFKNKILSAFGGKALYYISLIAMLVFILPMNIGDISLPKVPVNQTINVTEFEEPFASTRICAFTTDEFAGAVKTALSAGMPVEPFEEYLFVGPSAKSIQFPFASQKKM